MKIAYWDLETWDLSAEFGPILCGSVLLLPQEEMVSFRQDDYLRRKKAEDMTDDRQLCLDLRDLLNEQHLHAGYFSKGFDIAHLNTRLAHHEEKLLDRRLHLDAIWFFKGWRGLKPRSSKMKHVANYLGLEQKPEVEAEVWLKARGGNKEAMDVVQDRCEADVRITREITERALGMGLVKNITSYP